MKKTLFMLSFVVVMLSLGVSQAYAVPVVDGVLGAGEWANVNFSAGPYPYYLEAFDPNELGIPDSYDISHAVLLQELSAAGGTPGTGDDGVYLLIEVYSGDASLVDFDSPAIVLPLATANMSGDFNADGVNDIFLTHSGGNTAGTAQTALVANPAGFPIPPAIPFPGISITACNGIGGCGAFAEGTVLEYFLPAGLFGTPLGIPFPGSFIGTIIYDNGGIPSDDILVGTLIPEPSTIMLTVTGLLGMLGFGKFKFWN